MIPDKTVPGIRVGVMKESSGGGEFSVIYLIHCKNFCKCPHSAQQQQLKKKQKRNTNE
jgi:hypothetical protein